MFDSVTVILVSTMFWTIHYFLIRQIIHDKSAEFCNRIITLAHGSSVAFLGINQCFSGEVSPIYTPQEPSTNLQKFILVWSLGYFIFDLGWCMAYQTETPLMITHHLCSIASLWGMLMKETSGGQATCCLGALEVTNPFLQARWFVRTFGYHKTPLFHSVEIVYVLLFLFIRIGIGTFYIFVVLLHRNSLDYLVITVTMYTISWLFVLKILQYMQSKYSQLVLHWRCELQETERVDSSVIPSHS